MNSTVETETSWKVGALTVSDSGAWVVVVVVAAGRVVVAVIGPGAVVVVVVSGRVVVGAVVAVGAVVVVVVVAGRVVVVAVSGGDVEMVVVLVVAGTAVVVVARVLSGAAVEVGLEDGGGEGGSGGVIVVAEVIEVLEAGGSARVCVFSDPVTHAPRSNGAITTQAVGFLGICPERRTVREQCCRAIREGSPGSLGWMELAAVRVKWAPGKWTTLWPAGDPGSRHTLILAHGAGAGASHPLVAGLRDQLVAAGAFCVTFNYPYTEEGRRRPDRIDRLLACHRAVADWVRGEMCETPVLAGRSMGGRMGTYLAADGDPVRALVLYAYPLHPPRRPDRLRSEHLSRISVPMLFFRGSRDAFATSELFDREVRTLRSATVVDLEGLDHSFRGRGHRADEVNRRLAEMTVAWLETLGPDGFGKSARSGA